MNNTVSRSTQQASPLTTVADTPRVSRKAPMKHVRRCSFILVAGIAIGLLQFPGSGFGQTTATPPPAAQAAPVLKNEEIDQIVAPIALYPDDLLAQVLMASTYPLDIVQADRWVKEPANANLKGEQIATALQDQPWDPSVKSLVPFPQVLDMMSKQLDWTQKLGNAVLSQQKDVMDSIQRLRQKAQAADTLKTNEQQVVTTEPSTQTIIIQPTNPEVVYVPSYNPTVVYGGWPYPSYPPYYYPSPYYPGQALLTGMAFATGAAIVGSLWGWGDCNWGGGNVNVNVNHYNNINRNNINRGRASQLPANGTRFDRNTGGSRQGQRGQGQLGQGGAKDFRGFSGGQGQGQLGGGKGQLGGGSGQLGGGKGQLGGGNQLGGQRGGANQLPAGTQRGQGGLQGGAGQGAGRGQGQFGGAGAGRPQNNAFGDFGTRGSTVRGQSQRGQISRGGGGGGRQFQGGGGRGRR